MCEEMEEFIQGIDWKIKCMERAILIGLMVENIQEIINMIKSMEMEYSFGQMVRNMTGNDLMANRRVLEL